MDEQFWNYNAANISQILKKSASLIQEVESSKLGLFEFESNIDEIVKSHFVAWIPVFAGMMDYVSIRY